uniref:MLH3 n=1 Tax=Arundo donax TaxID=35708 RepID=A0A0A9CYP2_ARUDO
MTRGNLSAPQLLFGSFFTINQYEGNKCNLVRKENYIMSRSVSCKLRLFIHRFHSDFLILTVKMSCYTQLHQHPLCLFCRKVLAMISPDVFMK